MTTTDKVRSFADGRVPSMHWVDHAAISQAMPVRELQAEVKLLLAQRDALLVALKAIEPILARMYGPQAADLPPMQIVRAAIAKAEGK